MQLLQLSVRAADSLQLKYKKKQISKNNAVLQLIQHKTKFMLLFHACFCTYYFILDKLFIELFIVYDTSFAFWTKLFKRQWRFDFVRLNGVTDF